MACPSAWTIETTPIRWNIGYSFCFLGYLMIGYTISKWAEQRKNNIKGVLFIIGSICFLILIGFLRYYQALNGIADDELRYSLYKPYSPLVVITSILLFTGFSLINLKWNLEKISSITFYIYFMQVCLQYYKK